MSSKRICTDPFSMGSTTTNSKTSPTKPSIHQKAAASLAALVNFNPTLSQQTNNSTKTKQSTYYQQQYYHQQNAPNYYNVNHNHNKRTFHAMNHNYHNYGNNNYQNHNKRRRRQKYPNDGGLTDAQYERIIEARKCETKESINAYIEERKSRYPTKKNIDKKREIINVKTKRGQLLSINEKIMKFQDDTGNKKTPSVLRFLKTPRFDQNIVRKVLSKEIEQEYSAILQCFRYIIKTNFLQNDDEANSNMDHHEQREDMEMKDNSNVDDKEPSLSAELEGDTEKCAFDMQQIQKHESLMEQDQDEDEDDDLNLDMDNILAQQTRL